MLAGFPTTWLIAGGIQNQDLTSFEDRFSGQNAQTARQSKAVAVQVAEPVAQSTVANVAAVQPPGIPPQAPATAAPESSAPGAAQPPQRAVEISVNPPNPFAIRQLEHEEIVDLIRRGEVFIATGDIAAARLVLQRAAEAGDARAALMLAGTYDPIILEKLSIQGLASDIAAARTWYERAEFGSAEAMRRLEILACRAR